MGWNPVQLYDQYVTSVLVSNTFPRGLLIKFDFFSTKYLFFMYSLPLLQQEERVHSEGAAADLVTELQEARKRYFLYCILLYVYNMKLYTKFR